MKQTFHLQKDFADCGPVCLQNILGFYKVNLPLEMLRGITGTGDEGATLLGLYQAAEELGFTPMGAEAESIDNLAEVNDPCILHLTIEGRLYHYVIFYPQNHAKKDAGQGHFTIGDPSAGIQRWDRQLLEDRWRSKALLLLKPTEKLQARKLLETSKWSWLAGIVKKDLDLLYLAAFLGLIIATLNLSTAVFSQKLVDNILPHRQTQKVFLATALFGLLLLIRSGISRLRSILLAKQSYQFNLNLTTHFLGSLLYLPRSFFDSRKTGDLTSRLNDISRIQQALSYIVGDIGVQALFLLIALCLIFSYSLSAGIGCLLILPLQFWVVRHHERRILAGYRETMKANAAKESGYIDTINGIGTIKALNKEPLFIDRGKTKMDQFQQELLKLAYHRIRFVFNNDLVGALFMITIVLICALAVLAGSLTTGQLFAVVQLAVSFLQAAGALALTNLQLQEAKAALERIAEFNHIPPESQPPATSAAPPATPQPATSPPADTPPEFQRLSIRDMTFRFRGRGQLLQNVSLELAKGEIISIIGESGQGKSTLFHILQKMYQPESGCILINGEDWRSYDTTRWRELAGAVPQDVTIFGGTLLENIAFEEAATRPEKVIGFCREYGFLRHFARLRHGGGTLLGEGGIRLSGGEKQLLGLARCLYRSPSLLLLDEPTASMDTNLRSYVMDLFRKISRDKGIILISHDTVLAGMADRVYVLADGTLRLQKKSSYVTRT